MVVVVLLLLSLLLLTFYHLLTIFSLFFHSFEEPCYVGRHLLYVIFVGITQILLYALGLPIIVFIFLRRHRHELDKPVVKFRYGLFFSGFSKRRYFWEVMVAIRKESTVILAVFGPQMGVAMLAHVALFVFMIQLLVQVSPQRYFSGVPGVLIRLVFVVSVLTLFSLFSFVPLFRAVFIFI